MNRTPAVRRKFALIGAGWLAGLFAFLNTGALCAFWLTLTAAAAIVSAAVFARSAVRPKIQLAARYLLFLLCAAVAGVCFFAGYSRLVYEPIKALDGRNVTLVGTVTECRTLSDGRHRLTVSGRINGRRTRVVMYEEGFAAGDGIRAGFKAQVPENTVSFDGEDYYRSLGVYLEPSGKAAAEKTDGGSAIARAVGRFREYTLSRIYENCGGETGAVIASMLCADKSRLTQKTSAAVYRAGLGHLFAVSGTHIVILAGFLSLILGRLPLSKPACSVITIAVMLLFAMFAGFTPSVLRACLMMSISQTAVFFDRHGDSANSLGAAALLITLANPFAITSVSFQLSFTAAAAFGILSPALTRDRVKDPAVRYAVSCVCVNVLSMPICATAFSEISLVSAAANLLLIPLCTVCLYLAFIFTLTGGVLTPVIATAELAARLMIGICRAVTASPLAYAGTYYSGLLAAWGIITSAVFIAAALVKKSKRSPADIAKCVGLYAAVCILTAYVSSSPPSDRLVIYPAEKGYTAVIVTEGGSAICDMGARGKFAYPAARMTERVHSREVSVFVTGKDPAKTIAAYENRLSDEPLLVAAAEDIRGMVSVSGLLAEPSEGGLRIIAGGREIILAQDKITAGGRSFDPRGLKDVTELKL